MQKLFEHTSWYLPIPPYPCHLAHVGEYINVGDDGEELPDQRMDSESSCEVGSKKPVMRTTSLKVNAKSDVWFHSIWFGHPRRWPSSWSFFCQKASWSLATLTPKFLCNTMIFHTFSWRCRVTAITAPNHQSLAGQWLPLTWECFQMVFIWLHNLLGAGFYQVLEYILTSYWPELVQSSLRSCLFIRKTLTGHSEYCEEL